MAGCCTTCCVSLPLGKLPDQKPHLAGCGLGLPCGSREVHRGQRPLLQKREGSRETLILVGAALGRDAVCGMAVAGGDPLLRKCVLTSACSHVCAGCHCGKQAGGISDALSGKLQRSAVVNGNARIRQAEGQIDGLLEAAVFQHW